MRFRRHRRPTRLGSLRGAVAFALVLAHVVSAIGFPQVRAAGATGVGCGGGVCGCGAMAAEGCRCDPAAGGACATKPVPKPTPAPGGGACGRPTGICCCGPDATPPDPAACPKCKDKATPAPAAAEAQDGPTVTWVLAANARPCRGQGPLGVVAEEPSAPPVEPVRADAEFAPAVHAVAAEVRFTSPVDVPESPPPRAASHF